MDVEKPLKSIQYEHNFNKLRLERNFHFLISTANILKCEMFDAFPSECQQPPGPASSAQSLRHILQPNTWSSSHLLASQMKNWGRGAWASPQDQMLVRARVGSEPWTQFLWRPLPSRPPQASAWPSKFSHLPPLSATRCLCLRGDKKQARGRKGTRRIRSAVRLLWGLLRADPTGGQHFFPVPAPPVWGQCPVPAASMGPPA